MVPVGKRRVSAVQDQQTHLILTSRGYVCQSGVAHGNCACIRSIDTLRPVGKDAFGGGEFLGHLVRGVLDGLHDDFRRVASYLRVVPDAQVKKKIAEPVK